MADPIHDHLALALVPGLGPKLTAALLRRFGSAAAARQATAAQLRQVPHIGDTTAEKLAAALRAADVETELRLLAEHGVRPVPLGFAGYPPPLERIPDPPPLLYFRGEWAEADANAVAIVGSRSCTGYGKKLAEQIARGLARAGVTVVSGLARGIDAAAHRGALEGGGRTLAVLAGGLSRIYPPEHTEFADEIAARGAVLTETVMAADPLPALFHARNRVISGLSRAVVVVEANAKSGALITARHAAEQGREVFAVPGNVDSAASAGCLELLRTGARLVRSADDVLDDLKGLSTEGTGDRKQETGRKQPARESETPTLFTSSGPLPSDPEPELPPPPPPELDATQQKVWDLLSARRHADELARETGLGVSELSRVLMQLEMKRLVRRLPGNHYERR
jgi:DNA processing protein